MHAFDRKRKFQAAALVAVLCPLLATAADPQGKPAPCTGAEIVRSAKVIRVSFGGGRVNVSDRRVCIAPGTLLSWSTGANEDFEANFPAGRSPFASRETRQTKGTIGGGKPVACKTTDANFDASLKGCWARYTLRHKTSDGTFRDADPDIIVSPPSDAN
jgi:hypothetical protein